MRTLISSCFLVTLLAAPVAEAKGKAMILRGGFGLLYPDHNSLANPGQLAIGHGFAAQAAYARTPRGGTQSTDLSFAYGDGRMGWGAFGRRSGGRMDVPEATDEAGAAFGLSMAKERITAGASFSRVLDAPRTNDGVLTGALNFNSARRQGVAVGFSASSEINGSAGTQTGSLGVGYGAGTDTSFEGNYTIRDFKNLKSALVGAFGNVGGGGVYASFGYQYGISAGDHYAMARLGVHLGGSVDVSAKAWSRIASGAEQLYGATLRALF